jgi:hypothetical protein
MINLDHIHYMSSSQHLPHQIMGGDLANWELHMKGLETMIKLKGGLQTLGLDGLLHRMILWYCYKFLPNIFIF